MSHWAAPGIECQCLHRGDWFGDLISYMLNVPMDGPKFMAIHTIQALEYSEVDNEGHRIKLVFAEFPGEHYCACQFTPLQKIEDEVKETTKAPVDETV